MDSELKVFLLVVMVAVVSLFVSVAAVFINETNQIVKLVGDGADPIKAACAVGGWSSSPGRAVVCMEAASK